MTNPPNSSTISGIIQAYKDLKSYFEGYQPDKRSVTYDYRNKTAEMMLKITVPDNLGRKFRAGEHGKVQIPLENGFRFVDMFSPGDFETMNASWSKTDSQWVMDPTELPSGENFLVRLEKSSIEDDIFDKIIDFSMPNDPMTEDGDDIYYIQSAITEPSLFEDVYEEFRIENVDIEVKVAVQGCFSTAIPDRIPRSIRRSQKLLQASNKNDYRELRRIHGLRKGTRDAMEISEMEAVHMIKNLTSSDHFSDYIDVTPPYEREEITQTPQHEGFLPENVNVDVSTNLDLNNRAAKGKLKFFKNEYTEYIKEKTEDIA